MKIRLTRRLAEMINGVDLSRVRPGDVIDIPLRDAGILLAEGWAALPDDESTPLARTEAADTPSRKRRA